MNTQSWKKTSDTIFVAITTGSFNSFQEASDAVVQLYVPDMTFSRAGIADALKRLETHYTELTCEVDSKITMMSNDKMSITDKIMSLQKEIIAKRNIVVVDGWNNFCRVFQLPNTFPHEFCFNGGIDVTFKMVDWFHPISYIGNPSVTKGEWVSTFGHLDGVQCDVDIDKLKRELIESMQHKQYVQNGMKYFVMCDFDFSFSFVGCSKVNRND